MKGRGTSVRVQVELSPVFLPQLVKVVTSEVLFTVYCHDKLVQGLIQG